MQFSKQREIPDPENFAWAYGYDEQGFYIGMVRRQENPMRQGTYLLPRNSTPERPPFKDGFRPRWNGNSWDLVEAKVAAAKEQTMQQAIEETRFKIFQDMERNLSQIIEVQVAKRIEIEFERFQRHFETLVHDLNREAISRASDELDRFAQIGKQVIEETARVRTSFEERIESVMTPAVLAYVDEQVRKAKDEMLQSVGSKPAGEVAEKPGLIKRVFG